jgi:hypothetical protein
MTLLLTFHIPADFMPRSSFSHLELQEASRPRKKNRIGATP